MIIKLKSSEKRLALTLILSEPDYLWVSSYDRYSVSTYQSCSNTVELQLYVQAAAVRTRVLLSAPPHILRLRDRESRSKKGVRIHPPCCFPGLVMGFMERSAAFYSIVGDGGGESYCPLPFPSLHQVLLPSCHHYLLPYCPSLTSLHREACWRQNSSGWVSLFMLLRSLHMLSCALFCKLNLNMGSGDHFPPGMNRRNINKEARAYQLGDLDFRSL